jgi:hypothetical protein
MKENQLSIIVSESGLEKTKADFILEKFQDSFKLSFKHHYLLSLCRRTLTR